MKFYTSTTQFYESGNSTGGRDVLRTFTNLEEALTNMKEWLSKYKTSIDPEEYEVRKLGDWTTYRWKGEFEIYGKITDVVTLCYDHTQKEQEK